MMTRSEAEAALPAVDELQWLIRLSEPRPELPHNGLSLILSTNKPVAIGITFIATSLI